MWYVRFPCKDLLSKMFGVVGCGLRKLEMLQVRKPCCWKTIGIYWGGIEFGSVQRNGFSPAITTSMRLYDLEKHKFFPAEASFKFEIAVILDPVVHLAFIPEIPSNLFPNVMFCTGSTLMSGHWSDRIQMGWSVLHLQLQECNCRQASRAEEYYMPRCCYDGVRSHMHL